MRVLPGRKRWWLLTALLLLVALFTFVLLRATSNPVTVASAQRIVRGMTREEVERILGPSNFAYRVQKPADDFWDSRNYCGCQYVAITVYFNAEEKVDHTGVKVFWEHPWTVFARNLRRFRNQVL